jgi:predicted ArsR family transcriptional regulator
MSEIFGERRKGLLRHLFMNKAGATVQELVEVLSVTRTAVRQHIASLMRDGLVAPGSKIASGGRPRRLFALTDKGRAAFPRHFSWFGELLVEAVASEGHAARLPVRLRRIAAAVVAQGRRDTPAGRLQSVEKLAKRMNQLGYDAQVSRSAEGGPAIEASNCIFHDLAVKHPAVCEFDLALLSGYSGARVELHECMTRGGRVCRFKMASANDQARAHARRTTL